MQVVILRPDLEADDGTDLAHILWFEKHVRDAVIVSWMCAAYVRTNACM